jgi:hypothetical protein
MGSLAGALLMGSFSSHAQTLPQDNLTARPLKAKVDSLLRHGRAAYQVARWHANQFRSKLTVQKLALPVLLIGTGVIILDEVGVLELEVEIDESVRHGARRHLYRVRTNIDDYLRHVRTSLHHAGARIGRRQRPAQHT